MSPSTRGDGARGLGNERTRARAFCARLKWWRNDALPSAAIRWRGRSQLLIEADRPQCADALVHHRPHLGRDQPRGGIDDVNRQRLGFELLQDVPELAHFPVWRDLVRKKHAETETVHAGIERAVDLVA